MSFSTLGKRSHRAGEVDRSLTSVHCHRIRINTKNLVAGVLLLFSIAIALPDSTKLAAQESSANLLTGAMFRRELERPLSASWSREQLRQMLKQVSVDRRIAIVLDRRTDPSSEFPINVTNKSLRSGLQDLIRPSGGDVSPLESAIYLGPKSAVTRLRTLIELRSGDMRSKQTAIPDRRRIELLRHRAVHWNDLDTPQEILKKVSSAWDLTVSNIELIPHDLWAGAVLPEATVTEALSVVLIQFDLTFQWTSSGSSIRLVPIPDDVRIEKRHQTKQKPADALAQIRQHFPEVEAQIVNSALIVKGSVEDQEAITALLRGDAPSPAGTAELPRPIRQRLFTFSVDRPVPLSAVMKKLEESDIRFAFDAAELKAAGIDLDQMIEVKKEKATADEFFKALFESARIDFQIDGLTVTLKPKKRSGSKD